MSKSVYILQAELFKTLSHPLRVKTIDLLREGELCFREILEHTGGLKSSLSQHLAILVNIGILKVRKDSRCNYYKLTSPKVVKLCALVREILSDNLQKNLNTLAVSLR